MCGCRMPQCDAAARHHSVAASVSAVCARRQCWQHLQDGYKGASRKTVHCISLCPSTWRLDAGWTAESASASPSAGCRSSSRSCLPHRATAAAHGPSFPVPFRVLRQLQEVTLRLNAVQSTPTRGATQVFAATSPSSNGLWSYGARELPRMCTQDCCSGLSRSSRCSMCGRHGRGRSPHPATGSQFYPQSVEGQHYLRAYMRTCLLALVQLWCAVVCVCAAVCSRVLWCMCGGVCLCVCSCSVLCCM